jgi:hypothetical protein
LVLLRLGFLDAHYVGVLSDEPVKEPLALGRAYAVYIGGNYSHAWAALKSPISYLSFLHEIWKQGKSGS